MSFAATIRKDQKAWLDGHPSINVSGLLQEAIDQKIEAEKAQKE